VGRLVGAAAEVDEIGNRDDGQPVLAPLVRWVDYEPA
jgi:hypothetical protein